MPSRTLRQYGTEVLTGPFGTVLSASEYVQGGVPLINPTHIKDGRILPEYGVSVTNQAADRIRRHRLAAGDIVMGRKGDVGRSAIVTRREHGWLCGSDSIAIRSGPSLRPGYLALALRCSLYRQQLAGMSTGAMVQSVNEGALLRLAIPSLGLADQDHAIEHSSKVLAQWTAADAGLRRQSVLLLERRQALITAAVTGELEIPVAT